MTRAFDAALEKAADIDPRQAAKNCGFAYEGSGERGFFRFSLLTTPVKLSFPTLEGTSGQEDATIPEPLITITIYHLVKSDGSALTNRWISFSKLPGGQYSAAMRSYTSDRLRGHFLNSVSELETAAIAVGADNLDLAGDLAVIFPVFPRVPIALVYWQGDEEFPEARADFLFDESAAHHLPTDCYAILCSLITAGLINGRALVG